MNRHKLRLKALRMLHRLKNCFDTFIIDEFHNVLLSHPNNNVRLNIEFKCKVFLAGGNECSKIL